MWKLIIRVAIQQITASQALTTFFTDPKVKDVVAQGDDNGYSDALGVCFRFPLFKLFPRLTLFRIHRRCVRTLTTVQLSRI